MGARWTRVRLLAASILAAVSVSACIGGPPPYSIVDVVNQSTHGARLEWTAAGTLGTAFGAHSSYGDLPACSETSLGALRRDSGFDIRSYAATLPIEPPSVPLETAYYVIRPDGSIAHVTATEATAAAAATASGRSSCKGPAPSR